MCVRSLKVIRHSSAELSKSYFSRWTGILFLFFVFLFELLACGFSSIRKSRWRSTNARDWPFRRNSGSWYLPMKDLPRLGTNIELLSPVAILVAILLGDSWLASSNLRRDFISQAAYCLTGITKNVDDCGWRLQLKKKEAAIANQFPGRIPLFAGPVAQWSTLLRSCSTHPFPDGILTDLTLSDPWGKDQSCLSDMIYRETSHRSGGI